LNACWLTDAAKLSSRFLMSFQQADKLPLIFEVHLALYLDFFECPYRSVARKSFLFLPTDTPADTVVSSLNFLLSQLENKMTTSTPVIKTESSGFLQRLNTFLDKRVLPYPVMFLSNRVIILATLALLVPLLFFAGDQSFVNALNSYLNVMSVVVSSTVLLYATIADVRDRAAAKRAEEIAKAYEQVLEERVQGREEITKAYRQVLEERVQVREEIAKAYEQELEKRVQVREQELEERVQMREEIAKAYELELEKRIRVREQELEGRVQGREEMAKAYEQVLERRVQIDHDRIEQLLQLKIDGLLGQRLEKIRVEDRQRLEEMEKAVIASNESLRAELAEKALLASNESLRAELAELKALVQALYQNHFGKAATSDS
jgi:hypothetical protein